MSGEKLLMAKELSAAFAKIGVLRQEQFFRLLIRECPRSLGRQYISFEDALEWWRENPDWHPHAKNQSKWVKTVGVG